MKATDEKLFTPANEAAEAAVIGSMIIDSACVEGVSAIVQVDDFYPPEHRIIFKTIIDLQSEGKIDGLLVRQQLEDDGQLEKVGGVEYIAKILDNVPSSANAEHYAEIVKSKSRYRFMVNTAEKISKVVDSTDGDIEGSIYQIKQLAEGIGDIQGKSQLVTQTLSSIEPKPIHYIWNNRIPLGMLTEFCGDPDTLKTWFTLYMASKISTGGTWPDGDGTPDGSAPLGSVILLSGEDGLARTIRPRLDSMGADVSKIITIEAVRIRDGEGVYESYFNLQRDLYELELKAKELKDCKLIILDPVNCFLGGIDSHRDSDVRGILMPLVKFAEQYNIAVVFVRHLNKNNTNSKAIYRGSGSGAFTAAARTSWLFSKDPNNPDSKRRLMTPAKQNILIDPTGLAFEIIGGKLVFGGEPVTMTSDEALGGGKVIAPKRDEAVEWIREQLPAGKSITSAELTKLADKQGVTKGTLERARKEAGVRSYPLTIDGKQIWFVDIPTDNE